MKMALILTTRNKVRYTEPAVRSMFMQEGPPLELLLSDSGSDDGTLQILKDMAQSYNGPHTVRVLECPVPEAREWNSIAGLNAHVNWVVTQTDAEVLMQLSGDDYDLAQRALLTREAYEAHKPSMVCCAQFYVTPDMKYLGETPRNEGYKDRWLTMEDMTVGLMGGSTCQAWDREFWEKIGGLQGIASMDVVMPPLAVADRGAWLSAKPCHAYRKIAAENNTGLEGVYYSYAENDARRIQTEELMHFQILSGYYTVLEKMDKAGLRKPEYDALIAQCALDRAASWANCRGRLTAAGIPPIPFKL